MAATPAERMRAVRIRRRTQGRREVRLILPDARAEEVRARVADAVARLDGSNEEGALAWIEAVSEPDEPEAR